MSEPVIDAERFFRRLEAIRQSWTTQKAGLWNGADTLCIPMGKATQDDGATRSKQAAVHLYLTGYEWSNSIWFITKTKVVFVGNKKAQWPVIDALNAIKPNSVQFVDRCKDENQLRENLLKVINNMRGNSTSAKLGTWLKGDFPGPFIPFFNTLLEEVLYEKVDATAGFGYVMTIKEQDELDMCKKAAVLTNKVLKHKLYKDLESVIDEEKKINHSQFAEEVEKALNDPNLIQLKVPEGDAESCYTPIIQSGGVYDIRISAQSDDNRLESDLIICSLGAKYKDYHANMARTFMVNAPRKVEETYKRLIDCFERGMSIMTPGRKLKDVMKEIKVHIEANAPDLLNHLPKTFGFAIGLEFRDSSNLLNEKNEHDFAENQIFTFSLGFHNVPLSKSERGGYKLDKFSVLLADTVKVVSDGPPEILTKFDKEFKKVCWTINDSDGDDDDDDDDDDDEGPQGTTVDEVTGTRRSNRNRAEKAAANESAANRLVRQRDLMEKRAEQARKDVDGGVDSSSSGPSEEVVELKEQISFTAPTAYPKEVRSLEVRMDMQSECLFLPICGHAVPFHMSMIKQVSMPEPDRATYFRVNFYAPGAGGGKDTPKNTQLLLEKYAPLYPFIKDLTFRSLDPRSVSTAFRNYQELRKRIRARAVQAEQERGLVEQARLTRIKDQRVPRLQDLTMKPSLSNRKCVGTLESHTNGLRFTSTKGEVLDIMYNNISHAIYQPCHKSLVVLVHFHLKDAIMVGKKKHDDIQFFTEVVDASENLDAGRRSSYDPDEMESEQREREMRKRVNAAFKDFCKKVERVAKHYEFKVEFDVPYNDLGFYGNHSKEMVFITPTLNCLVNLTETPFFCLDLKKVDHAHFERVVIGTKNFDIAFLNKDPFQKPVMISLIEMKYMDGIQDWLTDIGITCTVGGVNMEWEQMYSLEDVGPRNNPYFWSDVDKDGVPKPIGWAFLDAEGNLDNEGESDGDGEGHPEDDESDFSEAESGSDSEDMSSDDESLSASSSEDDDDDDDSEEEEGKDWDEMERDAAASDRQKRSFDVDEEPTRKKRR
jgi:nucleosome binding factor SPN SPT16 subunit